MALAGEMFRSGLAVGFALGVAVTVFLLTRRRRDASAFMADAWAQRDRRATDHPPEPGPREIEEVRRAHPRLSHYLAYAVAVARARLGRRHA